MSILKKSTGILVATAAITSGCGVGIERETILASASSNTSSILDETMVCYQYPLESIRNVRSVRHFHEPPQRERGYVFEELVQRLRQPFTTDKSMVLTIASCAITLEELTLSTEAGNYSAVPTAVIENLRVDYGERLGQAACLSTGFALGEEDAYLIDGDGYIALNMYCVPTNQTNE